MKSPLAAALAFVGLAWTLGAGAQVAASAPETVAVGDWQVAPVIELRARGEYWHDLDGEDRGLLVERARLGADASRGPLEARLVLQDAGALDLSPRSGLIAGSSPVAFVGAYEAWGEAHTASARPSFLRVGRQAVTWGEGRLLSAADWSPTGRSLDAVRGRLVVGDAAFELLAAVLTDPAVSSPLNAYGELFGARGEWALAPLFAIDAYALARLAQANPAASLEGTVQGQTYTGALRLHGDARPWTWGAEGAYQGGHIDADMASRAAWAAAGHVAFAFERLLLTPTVVAGVSYASGGEARAPYRGFDPLLPDVYVLHGAMDLFTWSNEQEANARVAITPWADAVAAIAYRYARLAQPGGPWVSGYLTTLAQTQSNTQADLGQEVDATLTWAPWAPVDLLAGYSLFVFADGARALLGIAGPSHFAYAQAKLTMP